MRLIGALIATSLAGCVSTNSVACEDGRTCPAGLLCDTIHTLCVTAAQTTACENLDEGRVCNADGLIGVCDQD